MKMKDLKMQRKDLKKTKKELVIELQSLRYELDKSEFYRLVAEGGERLLYQVITIMSRSLDTPLRYPRFRR